MGDFSNVFRHLRTTYKLSQQELAVHLGISKSAVSMYEQGRRQPDFETLERIADFFRTDTDYLLGRNEQPKVPAEPLTIAAHLDTSDLTKAELDDVASYIEFLRSKRK